MYQVYQQNGKYKDYVVTHRQTERHTDGLSAYALRLIITSPTSDLYPVQHASIRTRPIVCCPKCTLDWTEEE